MAGEPWQGEDPQLEQTLSHDEWGIIKARFERAERRIDALQAQADAIGATCLRVDEIVHAHQPFIDRVRAREVAEVLTSAQHTFAQELSDAVLALRQMSSALEDLVRRGTK